MRNNLQGIETLACPTVEERLYGLSLIWQEANYNFAFFDQLPDLDWEASYKQYIPRVIAADDIFTYYDLLERFVALLKDGHTLVSPPMSVYLSLDRPKLTLMNIGSAPVVTNASQTITSMVPIGSELLEIDGMQAEKYLAAFVFPVISENTPHRLRDQAAARLLLGLKDSKVHCKFRTPDGNCVEIDLLRNRRTELDPWLRPSGVPDRSEFMYFDEWRFNERPITAFEFKLLQGTVGYVALNTFMDSTVVTCFEEKLPILRDCSGIILDLRKNHGGNDGFGYSIVSHFLRQPTETCLVRSQQHLAVSRARGISLKNTPPDKLPNLSKEQTELLRCYQHQWFHEESWGNIQPAPQILAQPTVILTDSETGSAAEDFTMAFQSGKGQGIRMGRSTAGSTGQPLIQELPGGGMFSVCTVRMPWPEKVWRKGIEPHIPVEPTVEDVMLNEDRALKSALRYLCG